MATIVPFTAIRGDDDSSCVDTAGEVELLDLDFDSFNEWSAIEFTALDNVATRNSRFLSVRGDFDRR